MKIKLKRATIKDLKFFYSLRNSKHNRKNFINTKKISFYEHSKWFEKAIMSKKDYFYKIIINKKTDCGYVRLNKKQNSFYVSICVDFKFRKKNIASETLLLVENKIPKGKALLSVIKKNNIASKLLFLKVGYLLHRKKKNLLFMKKKTNKLRIIDQIESIRGKNNVNWMNLLRLAYKKSPRESAVIMSKIYRDDSKISKLVKKLIRS